jgi:hypothetical protein
MASVYTANTVKVCLKFNTNGQVACNVFYVDLGVEPDVTDMTTLAALFKGWWDAEMADITHSGTSLQQIEVTDISNAGDDGIIYTTGLPSVGTSSGNALPNNVTVATKLLTGFTGRSRRGRKYFVGMSDNNISAGAQNILSAMQTAINQAYGELLDLIVAEGWQWVINSTISAGVPRTSGLNTAIINVATNLVLDSMRRRLPERGE